MKDIGCYRIIRFRSDGHKRTVKNGVTLKEAQTHCSRKDTHGPGWFDGYDLMEGVKEGSEDEVDSNKPE